MVEVYYFRSQLLEDARDSYDLFIALKGIGAGLLSASLDSSGNDGLIVRALDGLLGLGEAMFGNDRGWSAILADIDNLTSEVSRH